MEIDNMSYRQQPDQRAENSRRPPMRQAQKCGGVKHVFEILSLPLYILSM